MEIQDKIRSDWHTGTVKDDVMADVLMAKFGNDPMLKNMLLTTGDRKLIEASPVDAYWGWG